MYVLPVMLQGALTSSVCPAPLYLPIKAGRNAQHAIGNVLA